MPGWNTTRYMHPYHVPPQLPHATHMRKDQRSSPPLSPPSPPCGAPYLAYPVVAQVTHYPVPALLPFSHIGTRSAHRLTSLFSSLAHRTPTLSSICPALNHALPTTLTPKMSYSPLYPSARHLVCSTPMFSCTRGQIATRDARRFTLASLLSLRPAVRHLSYPPRLPHA